MESLIDQAYRLKNEEKYEESVVCFKKALELEFKPGHELTLAMILVFGLRRPQEALPYAQNASTKKPKSELASITFFHCLFKLGLKDDAEEEMTRFLNLGIPIDHYEVLLEENNLTVEDFIDPIQD